MNITEETALNLSSPNFNDLCTEQSVSNVRTLFCLFIDPVSVVKLIGNCVKTIEREIIKPKQLNQFKCLLRFYEDSPRAKFQLAHDNKNWNDNSKVNSIDE